MTTPATINTQQPQQFIVVTSPSQARVTVFDNFDGRRSRSLGITQIVFGVIIIVTSVIGLLLNKELIDSNYDTNYFFLGFGFWCPPFFLTSGSLGVVAAKQKTRKKLNALLGTSITSCLLSVAFIGWAALIVAIVVNQSDPDDEEEGIRIGVIITGSILLAAGLAQFVTSVWLSKLCGNHICKTEKFTPQRPQTVQYITTTNSQHVLMPHIQHQSTLPPVGSISAIISASNPMTSHLDSTMVIQQGVTPPGAETYPKMQPHTGNQHTQAEYRPYPVQPQAAYGASQPYPVQPQAAYGATQSYPVQNQPAYGAAQTYTMIQPAHGAAHPCPSSMQPGVHSTGLSSIATVPQSNVHADLPPSYDLAVREQIPNTEATDNLNNTAL